MKLEEAIKISNGGEIDIFPYVTDCALNTILGTFNYFKNKNNKIFSTEITELIFISRNLDGESKRKNRTKGSLRRKFAHVIFFPDQTFRVIRF